MAQRFGARRDRGCGRRGTAGLGDFEGLISRTRMVAVQPRFERAGPRRTRSTTFAGRHRQERRVLVDAAQSAPHLPIDVQALGCDFLGCSATSCSGRWAPACSGRSPTTLDTMPPYHIGSNMAHEVDTTPRSSSMARLKFQAGTPNVSGPSVSPPPSTRSWRLGLDGSAVTTRRWCPRASGGARCPGCGFWAPGETAAAPAGLHVHGPGVPAGRLVQALDAEGVAVRAGDTGGAAALERFGLTEAVRASCYLYTTTADIDRFAEFRRLFFFARPLPPSTSVSQTVTAVMRSCTYATS